MNTFYFVLCIIAIGCATSIVSQYMKMRAERDVNGSSLDDTEAQISALEERVRVLERIITEGKFDLRNEIDKL